MDLDLSGDFVDGHFYAYDNDPILPGTFGRIRTKNVWEEQTLQVRVSPLRPDTGDLLTLEQFQSDYPDIEFGETIELRISPLGKGLKVSWIGDNGVVGQVELERSLERSLSTIPAMENITTWREFRDYALDLPPRAFMFRGQSEPWPLRTSFHRTRRKDIIKFISEDVPILASRLSPLTKHAYTLSDPIDNAAFWNLIQHHGYPTPLLDWTYSPFVAAYFAFNEPYTDKRQSDVIRIFVFGKADWESEFSQLSKLTFARPHFSIIEPTNFENDRATPQQAIMAATNLNDIEHYIQFWESERSKRYLFAIDLPFHERGKVLSDLSLMGIGAGSLFPGLDGICAEIKERRF